MKIKTIPLLALVASVLSSLGQSGGPFELQWSTLDGGGGTSGGGRFALSGTIGQPDAGTLAGGPFKLEGGFWSGVTLLQSPGAPVLKIKFIGGGLAVLSWPVGVTGFALEETSTVGSAVWTATPQSVVDTAAEHTITVPASGVTKCYRLKK